MQRFLDLIFTSLAIAILLPVFLILIILLKFSGEGEIFYLQKRVGKNQREFKLFKFATMLKNSESMGAGTVTVSNDPRVLPIGSFLRKTKLNEIPQLFNIILGDMSIIGPRPLHSRQYSFYNTDHKMIISSIRPGLSGVASIFFRDEEKILDSSEDPDHTYKTEITPKKAKYELWYVKNYSILLYFKLIFLTIAVVLMPKLNISRFFPGEIND
tara:strand:- start:995 stop:1633 length:639 start_codon:yes stop_codon:yes gene_type:complete